MLYKKNKREKSNGIGGMGYNDVYALKEIIRQMLIERWGPTGLRLIKIGEYSRSTIEMKINIEKI